MKRPLVALLLASFLIAIAAVPISKPHQVEELLVSLDLQGPGQSSQIRGVALECSHAHAVEAACAQLWLLEDQMAADGGGRIHGVNANRWGMAAESCRVETDGDRPETTWERCDEWW